MTENQTISAGGVGELKLIDPHAPHAKSKVVLDKEVFCAACQTKTLHKMSRIQDRNGHHEVVATCDCGRMLKFPVCESSEFEAHLANHHAANTGQVTVEQVEADNAVHDERFKKMLGV